MKFKLFKDKVSEMYSDSIVEFIEELCEEQGEHELYDHMEHVANLASEFADHYELNAEEAYLAGFLHDVGRLIDGDEYLGILSEYGVKVTEQEKEVNDVLHGKVSIIIATELFQITSNDIIQGIRYHTTLRKHPSNFEKIIFIADKLTWTYEELIFRIEETVLQSLNVACFNALTWLVDHISEKNGVLLDDTKEAYLYFKGSMIL